MSILGFITFMFISYAIGKYGFSAIVRFIYRVFRTGAEKVNEWVSQEEQAIREATKDEH